MNREKLSEWVHLLANVGVVAGLVFLAFELRQNNQLLKLEAQTTLTENLQNGWDQLSSDPELVALFIKDRNGQALSEVEEFRLNAYWMGMLMRREWQFQHFPESKSGIDGLRRIFETYSSLTRTWQGSGSASRSAGKDNFSPEFVRFVDEKVKGPG